MKFKDIKNKVISLSIMLSAFIVVLILASCEDLDEIYVAPLPPGGCDTVNVTYSLTIQKIFNDKCVSCHGNSGGVDLNGYANVKTNVDNGELQKSITPGGSMVSLLTDCDAKQIIAWINKGAPNN